MQGRSYLSSSPETFPNFLLDFFEDSHSTELELFVQEVPKLSIFKTDRGLVSSKSPLSMDRTGVISIINRLAGLQPGPTEKVIELLANYLFERHVVFYPIDMAGLLFMVNTELCLLVGADMAKQLKVYMDSSQPEDD